jgi:replicative DNA helicase
MGLVERRFAMGDVFAGSPSTGLVDVDRLLGPLGPGTINVVAARPAAGRTAFLLGAVLHCASTCGAVLLVATNSCGDDVVLRLLGATAEVDRVLLRDGRLRDREWARLSRAREHLKVPLFVADGVNEVRQMVTAIDEVERVAGPVVLVAIDDGDELLGCGHHVVASVDDLRVLLSARSTALLASVSLPCSWSGVDLRAAAEKLLTDHPLARFADAVVVLSRSDDRAVPIMPAEAIIVRNRHGTTGIVPLGFRTTSPAFVSVIGAGVGRSRDGREHLEQATSPLDRSDL